MWLSDLRVKYIYIYIYICIYIYIYIYCGRKKTIYTSLYSYVLSTVLRKSKLLFIYIYIYTHISNTPERPCLTTFPFNEKRVENTTRREVFSTKFKHGLDCLIYVLRVNGMQILLQIATLGLVTKFHHFLQQRTLN